MDNTLQCGKRNVSMDLLRIFSCACIVLLHASGYLAFLSRFNLLIQAIVRPCLLVFIFISGYFVLSTPIKSWKSFYFKKIPGLLILLFIYSFIYQIYYNRAVIVDISSFFKCIDPKSILAGDIIGHFWFVYSLAGVYFIAPFLQKMLNSLSKNASYAYCCSSIFLLL